LGESRYFNTPVNKSKFFDYTIDYLKIKESNSIGMKIEII